MALLKIIAFILIAGIFVLLFIGMGHDSVIVCMQKSEDNL